MIGRAIWVSRELLKRFCCLRFENFALVALSPAQAARRMGQKQSLPFSEEKLQEYIDCTFLTRKQIEAYAIDMPQRPCRSPWR